MMERATRSRRVGLCSDISDAVFQSIEDAETFLVFGTKNYGEDTPNPANSCCESKYAQALNKRIILLRMTPYESGVKDFDHLHARVLFGQNKLEIQWLPGDPMPDHLIENLGKVIDIGADEEP